MREENQGEKIKGRGKRRKQGEKWGKKRFIGWNKREIGWNKREKG